MKLTKMFPGLIKLLNNSLGSLIKKQQLQISTKISIPRKRAPRKNLLRTYGLLVFPVATFGLGTWQYQRGQWKSDLREELQSKMLTPAIDFPEDVHDFESLEYRKIKLKGKFDHSKELFIGPRSEIVKGAHIKKGGGVFTAGGGVGYHVVTPFHLSDKSFPVLVNRGWVRSKSLKPETRLAGQVTEEVELIGIYRTTEKRAPFSPKSSDLSRNIHLSRDVNDLARRTNSAPFFFDAVESVPGGPTGGQTIATLRDEHFNYMVTWYTLSGLTSILWYMHTFKR